MKKVWIHGILGKMGQEISALVHQSKLFELVGGSDHKERTLTPDSLKTVDIVFDFSSPSGNEALLGILRKSSNVPACILIGTTGLSKSVETDWSSWAKDKNTRILFSPNTCLGILALTQLLPQFRMIAQQLGMDIEIVETHHRDKKDAPSGTALMLFKGLKDKTLEAKTHRDCARKSNEVGISSVRGGHVFGEHEIRLLGDHDEIRISHRAISRSLFAQGALRQAAWLERMGAGIYHASDIKIEELDSYI